MCSLCCCLVQILLLTAAACCVQESSGKTHTLQGTAADPGVIPRAMDLLFDCAAKHPLCDSAAVALTLLDVHGDAVHDLLPPKDGAEPRGDAADRPKLELRSDAQGAIAIGVHPLARMHGALRLSKYVCPVARKALFSCVSGSAGRTLVAAQVQSLVLSLAAAPAKTGRRIEQYYSMWHT